MIDAFRDTVRNHELRLCSVPTLNAFSSEVKIINTVRFRFFYPAVQWLHVLLMHKLFAK